jgi:hypothetical protein
MCHYSVGKMCEATTRTDVDKQDAQLSSLLPHVLALAIWEAILPGVIIRSLEPQ